MKKLRNLTLAAILGISSILYAQKLHKNTNEDAAEVMHMYDKKSKRLVSHSYKRPIKYVDVSLITSNRGEEFTQVTRRIPVGLNEVQIPLGQFKPGRSIITVRINGKYVMFSFEKLNNHQHNH